METNKTKQTAIDSGVKVGGIEIIPQKTVVIRRKMSPNDIADNMVSRVSGKLVGFADLYDPKTKQFLTEAELVKKGAVFVTIAYKKNFVIGKDTLVKSRITKEPIPYTSVIKTNKYQVIANINWESYVNKRGNGDFIASETRVNGVKNYAECKVIGETRAGNKTINGVAFRSLEKTRYVADGIEVDKESFETAYGKGSSKESKQKQADKHGIDVRFDPQYRTTRIDNCEYIRAFGFEYIPTPE